MEAMKILVAVDGSVYTKRMLAYIAAHEEWLGQQHKYTVLHCVPALPHRAAAFVDAASAKKFYDEDAESALKPIRRFFQTQSLDASFVHHVGAAAEYISKLAARGKFDLVIMGTHGHHFIPGIVLGSVAMNVLSLCTTPVLLVR